MLHMRMTAKSLSAALWLLATASIADAQQQDAPPPSLLPESQVQYALYLEGMDKLGNLIREVRETLNRTAFDLDDLLNSLDYDAAKINQFVKTHIAFEQYPGVLRAARGTLFSRAGNSIDQALLLATLLRDAGYDARITGTELSPDDAKRVLQAMSQPILAPPPFVDAEAIIEILHRHSIFDQPMNISQKQAYASYLSSPSSAEDSSVYESVSVATDLIMSSLDASGLEFNSNELDESLVNETRQYFWVQFRDLASEPWQDVHPVFAGEAPLENITSDRYFANQVPVDLQHRLRFQVFIERKVGDRLEALAITSPWEQPIANLIGIPLTFSNVSDSMLAVDTLGQGLDRHLMSSASFVPSFGGAIAPGARFFNFSGTLIDPMAAQDAAAGIFATINNAFASAIGSVGDKSQVPMLTAQWLQFTLVAPDGTERSHRRMILDRIGDAARQRNEIPNHLDQTVASDANSLMQRHTFMVGAGKIPRGYVIEAAYDHYKGVRPAVDAVVDIQYGQPAKARNLSDVPVGWPGHLALFALFDAADSIGPNHRNYRSGPALVVHSDGLSNAGMRFEAIDIVSNPRRSVDISRATPFVDPETAVRAGVWETIVEGTLLSGDGQRSIWRSFAQNETARPLIFVPGAETLPKRFTAATNLAIQADLNDGYAVIAADSSAANAGWWRVHLQSGETLGRIHDGRGGEVLETIVTMVITFASFAYGANGCMQIQDPAAQTCCHVVNTGMGLFGVLGIGVKWAEAIEKVGRFATSGASVTWDAIGVVMPTGSACEAAFSEQ